MTLHFSLPNNNSNRVDIVALTVSKTPTAVNLTNCSSWAEIMRTCMKLSTFQLAEFNPYCHCMVMVPLCNNQVETSSSAVGMQRIANRGTRSSSATSEASLRTAPSSRSPPSPLSSFELPKKSLNRSKNISMIHRAVSSNFPLAVVENSSQMPKKWWLSNLYFPRQNK